MYLKEYIKGLLTVGLTNNYPEFMVYCVSYGLPELPLNKFRDLEFDLIVAMRDVPTACPYISYMRYKKLDFMSVVVHPEVSIIFRREPCGGCGGGKVL